MAQRLHAIALVVRDYDEAIDYYTRVLDFTLVEDTQIGPEKRWVLITPPGSSQPQLLLAKAANPEQATRIGNQTGGRVFLFLHTDDFWADYQRMRERGVHFCETPREEIYATVVVFEDLYGNRWDFIQMKS
jgi:catechol 2,3-dioxygenase-like lactoylglutathione lyase family enzyme